MDLRLPDMDGIDAARSARGGVADGTGSRWSRELSLLEGDRDWLAAAGFAGYLEKPFSVRDFPGQVRGYCTGGEA